MIYEKSSGIIVFRKEKNKIFYLLLYKKANPPYKEAWDFPKGNVEKGEDEIKAAKRETFEETGIKSLKFIPDFREKIKIFYRKGDKLVLKEIIFYLAETKTKRVKISFEHNDYAWLPFQKALKKLTYKKSKEILKKANELLKSYKSENK